MLQIEGLCFNWSEDLHFTYGLSIARGEILALQGPSGVGKTTLLELIAGFQTPTAGKLTWDDLDLLALHPWQRPVTTVFQADNLFAHLTCLNNVIVGLGPKEKMRPNLLNQIHDYFAQLGLGRRAHAHLQEQRRSTLEIQLLIIQLNIYQTWTRLTRHHLLH